jgi:ABC-type Fe3+/spermidine/putrescine transport system ATPase subunit
MNIAEHVAVVRDGRVEQCGTPEEAYLRPASRWMATFLGHIEVLPGEARSARARRERGSLPIHPPLDGAVDVLVRPEGLAIGVSGPEGAARAEVVNTAVLRP